MTVAIPAEAAAAHAAAVAAGETTYIDPATGFMVFTEVEHLRRGHCCENDCRHCPFGGMDTEPTGRASDGPCPP